jgi:hypothetical protein
MSTNQFPTQSTNPRPAERTAMWAAAMAVSAAAVLSVSVVLANFTQPNPGTVEPQADDANAVVAPVDANTDEADNESADDEDTEPASPEAEAPAPEPDPSTEFQPIPDPGPAVEVTLMPATPVEIVPTLDPGHFIPRPWPTPDPGSLVEAGVGGSSDSATPVPGGMTFNQPLQIELVEPELVTGLCQPADY